ncbi:MAG TPA: NAD(P)H-dependent oxidoreductase [Devosiaceae bacterium]|jgi:NAD(P)H-dependent FMN reductase
MTSKPKIGIIIGTTRPTRFADTPTQWFYDLARQRHDAEFEIVDLRDYPLPFFDEAMSPMFGVVKNDVAQRWQQKLDELDGFVFVTAEYNHSISGVLKNALDYAYPEFNRKPATFIGYGGAGAARAVEHLRGILAELQVATLKHVVAIGMVEYLGIARQGKSFADFPYLADSTKPMLDDLVWWSKALKSARLEARQAAA